MVTQSTVEDNVSPQHNAVACTENPHKVQELALLLPELTVEGLAPGVTLPPEIGATFLDNARIKAYAGLALHPGRWIIADDSGLLVDALADNPGVHSARFAGPHATDAQNNSKLLDELSAKTRPRDRSARFVCVLVAITPEGAEVHAEGSIEGHIAHFPSGDDGFGYDPLFVPSGYDQSFAELGNTVKSKLSHRALAAMQLRAKLGMDSKQ